MGEQVNRKVNNQKANGIKKKSADFLSALLSYKLILVTLMYPVSPQLYAIHQSRFIFQPFFPAFTHFGFR